MKNLSKNNAALTLTEILITLTILSIAAALAVPKLSDAMEGNKTKEAESILAALMRAQIIYKDFNPGSGGAYATQLSSLDVTIPLPVHYNTPTVGNSSYSVATILRNGSSPYNYTLYVNISGTVQCNGGANNICTKLGYPKSLGHGGLSGLPTPID
ncbi:MAG: hypothetical protein A2Z88_08700 [Omnitrophica WOR_2 bacterium GWA2_47_8]|nr:MAG: hypothetical protein A2Z88_08700 [Omnitrophica WOR_2 bacterium GWA2_47_8]